MKTLDDLKVPGPIRKVMITDNTFKAKKQEVENVSLINFFYGNNGTGKSTVADTIFNADSKHVVWEPGVGTDSYTMMIFNQQFIDDNIQQYGNLPGVYTISEEASTAQEDIDKIEEAIKAAKKVEGEKEKAKIDAEKKIEKLDNDVKDDLNDASEKYKKKYPLAINMRKATIFGGISEYDNPQQQDEDEMTRLYDAAYKDDSRDYDEYKLYDGDGGLGAVEGSELLGKIIISSGTTPYAALIKALNNAVWLDEGHKKYHHSEENTENRCPYCGEILPKDIEDRIHSAIDADYQADVAALRKLLSDYTRMTTMLIKTLSETNKPSDIYPGLDATKYDIQVTAIQGIIAANIVLLQNKVNDPSTKVELEETKPLLEELKKIAEEYNALIRTNNEVRKKKSSNKTKFEKMFYEQLALDFAVPMQRYTTERTKAKAAETKAIDEYKDAVSKREQAEEKRNDIKVAIDTTKAIEEINAILKDVGFLGFQLVPHPTIQYAYVMERTDGSPAKNPSEGEKNFMAFLYFYEKVKGYGVAESSSFISVDGNEKEVVTIPDNHQKIVIIDDPVSSMDSGTMYVVGNLVRDLVTNCEKAATSGVDAIAQLFIFSHNAYFFRGISYNWAKNFEYVNFYTIDKQDEKSTISISVKETKHPDPKKAWANDIPVKDNYNALWDEYRSANSVTSLTNIIRRILEYYYLQMCGYEGENIYTKVIDDNRKLFTESELKVADSLLKYLNNEFHWLNDGLYYSDSAITANVCRRVFQKIFLYSGQDQHYRKMANEDIADDIKEVFEKRNTDSGNDESEISDGEEPEHVEVEIVE